MLRLPVKRSFQSIIPALRTANAPAVAARQLSRTVIPAVQQAVSARFFSSDDSHDDFKPQINKKTKGSSPVDDAIKIITKHVKTYPILLYMKGTPQQPMCGFSAQVVKILHAQGVDFDSVNVLAHPEIREGIKQYSQWPTIPQLYVSGEFVGGCDIVTDLHKSGELADLLKNAQGNLQKE